MRMAPNRMAALLDGSRTGPDCEAALAEVAALDDEDLGVFDDAWPSFVNVNKNRQL
jgi:hypothetical protein